MTPLPPLETVAQRLNRLRDPEYCGSEKHYYLDWTTKRPTVESAAPGRAQSDYRALLKFEKDFRAELKRQFIPAYCSDIGYRYVEICHCLLSARMEPDDWAFFGHIGKMVAKRNGLTIYWLGDISGEDSQPHCWSLDLP